jgi:RNA polymerase sigma-70 factor (ECF subfamily)
VLSQLEYCCALVFIPACATYLVFERLTTPLLFAGAKKSAEFWNKWVAKQVQQSKEELFERTVVPYLDSAYNLARWLTRNEQDAQDVVQEAFLRALRSFDTFVVGRDGRPWLLAIVRNSCRTWHRQNRSREPMVESDPDSQAAVAPWSDPEATLIQNANSQLIRHAMEQLPFEYREVLILRELEELSYKEIAQIAEIPLGTVMSRLSRARKELYVRLGRPAGVTEL